MFLSKVDKIGKKALIKSKETNEIFEVELRNRYWSDPKYDIFVIFKKNKVYAYRDSLRRRYYEVNPVERGKMFLSKVDKVGKKALVKSKETNKMFKVELYERHWCDPKYDIFTILNKKRAYAYRDSLRRRYYEI